MSKDWTSRTDAIVANFTRDLLGLAREGKVDFDYVGPKASKKAEIDETMKVNADTVAALLRKKD